MSDLRWHITLILIWLVILSVALMIHCHPAHAQQWYATIEPWQRGEMNPIFCWAEASGDPEGYVVYVGVGEDRWYRYAEVADTCITLHWLKWVSIARRAGVEAMPIRVEAVRGEEYGPPSLPSDWSMGVR